MLLTEKSAFVLPSASASTEPDSTGLSDAVGNPTSQSQSLLQPLEPVASRLERPCSRGAERYSLQNCNCPKRAVWQLATNAPPCEAHSPIRQASF